MERKKHADQNRNENLSDDKQKPKDSFRADRNACNANARPPLFPFGRELAGNRLSPLHDW